MWSQVVDPSPPGYVPYFFIAHRVDFRRWFQLTLSRFRKIFASGAKRPYEVRGCALDDNSTHKRLMEVDTRTVNQADGDLSLSHPDHRREGEGWNSVDVFKDVFVCDRIHVALSADGVALIRFQHTCRFDGANHDNVGEICLTQTAGSQRQPYGGHSSNR